MDLNKRRFGNSSQKYIIKSKPSKNYLRSQNSQQCSSTYLDTQVGLFLKTIVDRSQRFKSLLIKKQVVDKETFIRDHFLNSVVLKTLLRSKIDEMMNQKRLGLNLKGLNTSITNQILNCVQNTIERQIEIYQNQLMFKSQASQLKNILYDRKQEIQCRLAQLKAKKNIIKK